VTITLPRDEYPEINELEAHIMDLGFARNDLVSDYLRFRDAR
jgi:hypothetical protein